MVECAVGSTRLGSAHLKLDISRDDSRNHCMITKNLFGVLKMPIAQEVRNEIKKHSIDAEVIERYALLLEIKDKEDSEYSEYIELISNEENGVTRYRLTWAMSEEKANECLSKCRGITEIAFDGKKEKDSHTIEKVPPNTGSANKDSLWHIVIKSTDDSSDITTDWVYEGIRGFIKKRCIEENLDAVTGNDEPATKSVTVNQYHRSMDVRIAILNNAKGICECCDQNGPFIDDQERHYLEVHHVKPLAENGPDQINNTVAVCPNCHKALHYANDKKTRRKALVKKVTRIDPSFA